MTCVTLPTSTVCVLIHQPNVFQDQRYKFGSFGNPDSAVQRAAIDAHLECIDIMRTTGSDNLSLWFADSTNYQVKMASACASTAEGALDEVYSAMPSDARLLIEYKFFEPAFYHTDIPDWGTVSCCVANS